MANAEAIIDKWSRTLLSPAEAIKKTAKVLLGCEKKVSSFASFIHLKFDSLKLQEKEQIHHAVINTTYMKYEEYINNQYASYNSMVRLMRKFRDFPTDFPMKNFTLVYEESRGEMSLDVFYDGVMNKSLLTEHCDYDRRIMEHFCSHLGHLFRIGLVALMAYTVVIEDDEDEVQDKWAKRMKDIKKKMDEVLSQCKEEGPGQSQARPGKAGVDHDEELNPQLLKKYTCQLNMDPNTAHRNLLLSEGNRRVDWVEEAQPYPDHSERFDSYHQVLCREGLTGRCYWEVECKGLISVGVVHGRNGEHGQRIGYSDTSWCCKFDDVDVVEEFSFLHNGEHVPALKDPAQPQTDQTWRDRPMRLGVYLDWPAGILAFYKVSSDTMTHLHTFNTTFTEPVYPGFHVGDYCRILDFSKTETSFTPEMSKEGYGIVYKFRFPCAGMFQCSLTGLVFGVEEEADVKYETVQWDESLLQSAGKTPAGPLFSIHCFQGSVSQLHLPHCETNALFFDGWSVAHITADGMTILEPLRMTQTHVVVNVPHLSSFGLVCDHIKSFMGLPVYGQVLLFLRSPGKRRRILNMVLLPSNVPFEEVRSQQCNDENILKSSGCMFTPGQTYSLLCDHMGYKISPENAQFLLNYGPNYYPTFEVAMNATSEDVLLTLMVWGPGNVEVWRREVDLSDNLPGAGPSDAGPSGAGPSGAGPSGIQSHLAEERLLNVRTRFIKSVSPPVLDKLLDELLRQKVITDEEMNFAKFKHGEERAREVIDTVRRKGSAACSMLIAIFSKVDTHLSSQLNLTSGR